MLFCNGKNGPFLYFRAEAAFLIGKKGGGVLYGCFTYFRRRQMEEESTPS